MGDSPYTSRWERVQEAGIALRDAQTPAERHSAKVRLRSAAIQWVQPEPWEEVERAMDAVLEAEEDPDYEGAKRALFRALKRWVRSGKGNKSTPQGSLF